MAGDKTSSSFSTGKSAQERGLPYVPDCYIIPSSHRPHLAPETADVPIIDLTRLRQGSGERSSVIKELGNACRHLGFFQIVNNGICQLILDKALDLAFGFFNLSNRGEDEVHVE